MIFLDTNVAIGFLAAKSGIRTRFEAALARSESIVLSAIVAFELQYGVGLSERAARNQKGLDLFFERVPILSFTEKAAQTAGNLRAHLHRTGQPIGPYDVLIAAHALSEDALLVTNNTREFSRIPGLKTEDWLTP